MVGARLTDGRESDVPARTDAGIRQSGVQPGRSPVARDHSDRDTTAGTGGVERSAIRLQRSAGNRAVTHLLAAAHMVERRDGLQLQRQTEHIRTPGEVQHVGSFTGVPDAERSRLIGIVLDQFWVDSRAGRVLVR